MRPPVITLLSAACALFAQIAAASSLDAAGATGASHDAPGFTIIEAVGPSFSPIPTPAPLPVIIPGAGWPGVTIYSYDVGFIVPPVTLFDPLPITAPVPVTGNAVPPVPLPAGFGLLAGALGLFGLAFGRRRI